MKRCKYSQQDREIDEELAHYILNLFDKNDIGFLISSDINRMVFFSDYTTTMNIYKSKQKLVIADSVHYIDNEHQ